MVSLKFLNPLTSNRLSIIKSSADSIIPKTAEIVNRWRKKITDIQKKNYVALHAFISARLNLLLSIAISWTHAFMYLRRIVATGCLEWKSKIYRYRSFFYNSTAPKRLVSK